MKLFKKAVLLCLSIVMIISVCSGTISAYAAEDIKVKLISSALKAEPGDTFTVSYSFENANEYKYGLTAFTSKLKFDSTKIRCVNVIHSKFNNSAMSTNRSLTGEVRTLYTYASLTKDPGVNTNETFVTYVFVVTKDATAGNVTLSLDFDTIVTTDYDKKTPENIALSYNKPTFSVEIISDNVASTSSSASSAVSSNAASKDNDKTSTVENEVETNDKKPSDKAPDKITTVDDSYLNPEFSASDIATGEAVEKEPTVSELTESTANMLSSAFSDAGIDPNDVGRENGINPIVLGGLIALGIICIAGIVVMVVLMTNKKKN